MTLTMQQSEWLRDANRRAEYAIAALRRLPHREYLQTAHWYRVRVLALGRAAYQCALYAQHSGDGNRGVRRSRDYARNGDARQAKCPRERARHVCAACRWPDADSRRPRATMAISVTVGRRAIEL